MAGNSFLDSLDNHLIGVNDRYNVKVIGIIPFPNIWNPNIANKNGFSGYLFVCDGIKINTTISNALFPELLCSDLHEVRAVIETYNHQHNLQIIEGQLAAGFGVTFGYVNSEVMLDVEFEDFIIRYNVQC